jgi:hypothetical protein
MNHHDLSLASLMKPGAISKLLVPLIAFRFFKHRR